MRTKTKTPKTKNVKPKQVWEADLVFIERCGVCIIHKDKTGFHCAVFETTGCSSFFTETSRAKAITESIKHAKEYKSRQYQRVQLKRAINAIADYL